MKPVSPPLSSTRLSRLIYILVLTTALLALYYSYRIAQWKSDVGGWRNLVFNKHTPQFRPKKTGAGNLGDSQSRQYKQDRESVEDKINNLAQALGMPPADLASAIAVAVRQYVPPASLSSVAAEESGSAVKAMLKGTNDEGIQRSEDGYDQKASETGVAGHAADMVGKVVDGVDSFVGMDEP